MTLTKEHKDPEAIAAMFGKIAHRYDLTNSILSFQLHKYWNKALISSLKEKQSLVDLCSGTGDIAYRWLDKQKSPKSVTLLDFCEEMLEGAKARRLPHLIKGHQLRFIQADATFLPIESASTDGVSVAYGIRNIQEPEKCFKEAYRILKTNGKFAILELTEPKFKALKVLHQFYLNQVLPFLGGLLTKEKEAYRYLSSSVQQFSKPEDLKEQLQKIGFKDIKISSLTGGIATLIEASK